MPRKSQLWTVPNLLSAFRLVVFPVLLGLIVLRQEQAFAILFGLSLLSDLLDGWIARAFQLQTELGARLDSWGDTVTYIAGFAGLYQFRWTEMAPHWLSLVIFLGSWLALYGAMFWKFKSVVGWHTYAFKVTAYLQGICMMVLLWVGFITWLYYLAVIWGTLACLEEIAITILMPEPRTNVKGLFWVLRSLKS